MSLEEKIQRVVTNTIGYTRKEANNEWFDEECAKVNDAYKLARTNKRRLFRKKAMQLAEEASIKTERHRSF
jgi:hypothetical protein